MQVYFGLQLQGVRVHNGEDKWQMACIVAGTATSLGLVAREQTENGASPYLLKVCFQ